MKFVSKDLAIKLKEKGFDRPCFGWYYIETPTGHNEGELHYNRCQFRGAIYEDCLYSSNYDNLVDYNYDNIVDAPTIDQVLEWLREEKNIHIGIMSYFEMSTKNNIMWLWEIFLVGKIIECENTLYTDKDYNYTKLASADCYASYEDACIASIKYVVEHLI